MEFTENARSGTQMRRDKVLLTIGFVACVMFAVGTYLLGFGWFASASALFVSALLTRLLVYLYFERFLAFSTFGDFRSERILYRCIACGACCHLRVNLGKDDVERIVSYSRSKGLSEAVIEKGRNRYWLKRNHGECCFLEHSGGTPRCGIYSIRPIACRLYPLIPTGDRLRADPLCPGFNDHGGQTFKEFLRTQEVGAYVRKVIGRI
jgi:Fe-S-cluster containining protein